MIAEVTSGIRPELFIGELVSLGLLIGIFIFVKKMFGYSGVLFALCAIGTLYAGYHGIDRLNNFESADDVAGAILLGTDIFALLGLACYCHNRQSNKKE
jgi:hypothetical protein